MMRCSFHFQYNLRRLTMTTESTLAHEAATDVVPVWRPSPEYISGSHIERLIRALGIDLDGGNPEPPYATLYRRSITRPADSGPIRCVLPGSQHFHPCTHRAYS